MEGVSCKICHLLNQKDTRFKNIFGYVRNTSYLIQIFTIIFRFGELLHDLSLKPGVRWSVFVSIVIERPEKLVTAIFSLFIC